MLLEVPVCMRWNEQMVHAMLGSAKCLTAHHATRMYGRVQRIIKLRVLASL